MRRVLVFCLVALLIAVLAPTVTASSRQQVAIDSTMSLTLPTANTGTFTQLSDSNLICAAGSVADTHYVWGASRGRGGDPAGVQLLVDKTFFCPGGEIYFRLQVHGVFVAETFTWVIVGGTGDYAGLNGQGSGTTDYAPPAPDGTVVNHYTGYLVH